MRRVELVSIDGIALDVVVHEPADGPSRGTVVQAHGITADLDEGGMFARLAERLAEAGFAVLRFPFRGHGRSGGTQAGVTVAGAMLDVQAATDYAAGHHPGPLSVVAASFGAVPVALSLPYLAGRLHGLVLWNPVLDLRKTFVEPELPWGIENFGPTRQALLGTQGFLLIDGEFRLGRVAFAEFRRYGAGPAECFVASAVPALVVHGDRDSYVSYAIAREAAAARPGCVFHTVRGSDHGFDSWDREEEAIAVTAGWLDGRHPGSA